MSSYRLPVTIVLVVLSGWFLWGRMGSAPRETPVDAEDLETIVFVCRESGELFVGKVRPTPAAHPATGRPTLMPGLYDSKSQRWVAGPPLEQWQRQPPRPGSTMQPTGPLPAEATQLP